MEAWEAGGGELGREAGGGAGVGVGYRGCPSGNSYVLHDLIGASSRGREQFYCWSVVPWNALVCVVSHSRHLGGRPRGYWCAHNLWRGGNLTMFMAVVGMVSMVAG